MAGCNDKSAIVKIFFVMYSDGKESSKDGGHGRLFAFPTNPNKL